MEDLSASPDSPVGVKGQLELFEDEERARTYARALAHVQELARLVGNLSDCSDEPGIHALRVLAFELVVEARELLEMR